MIDFFLGLLVILKFIKDLSSRPKTIVFSLIIAIIILTILIK